MVLRRKGLVIVIDTDSFCSPNLTFFYVRAIN